MGNLFSSLRSYHTGILTISKLVPVFLLSFLSMNVKGQNTEIGLELGAYNYLGDIVRSYDLSNHTFGGQFFIRKHVNDGLSIRISAGVGSVKGADDENFDIFSANRSASFEGDIINSDFLFEYHFLNYRDPRSDIKWTPYVLLGAGLYQFRGTDQDFTRYDTGLQMRVPVGIGLKFKLDRRWVLGISTSAIATYSDEIDNIFQSSSGTKNFQVGNPSDNDWMFFTGISLSYTFYRIVCPVPFFRNTTF